MRKTKKDFCIFIVGARKMSGITKRDIDKAIVKMAMENGKPSLHLRYVVMGNVRETEKIAYNMVRKHHLPVCVVPADFEHHGINAEGFRNGLVLSFFSPKKIIIAHRDFQEESLMVQIHRWAATHNAEVHIVPSRKEKK